MSEIGFLKKIHVWHLYFIATIYIPLSLVYLMQVIPKSNSLIKFGIFAMFAWLVMSFIERRKFKKQLGM